MSDRDPSQERLLERFEYRDGKLYNRTTRSNRAMKGAEAGCKLKVGYRKVRMDDNVTMTHRLIYIMHNGDIEEGLEIDHKNGIKDDNRIDNLRLVTTQENALNRPKAKGYYWVKERQKYYAKITVDGKSKFLGLFDLAKDAAQAYQVAKEKYHIIEKR